MNDLKEWKDPFRSIEGIVCRVIRHARTLPLRCRPEYIERRIGRTVKFCKDVRGGHCEDFGRVIWTSRPSAFPSALPCARGWSVACGAFPFFTNLCLTLEEARGENDPTAGDRFRDERIKGHSARSCRGSEIARCEERLRAAATGRAAGPALKARVQARMGEGNESSGAASPARAGSISEMHAGCSCC
jgi:hypothetical protein